MNSHKKSTCTKSNSNQDRIFFIVTKCRGMRERDSTNRRSGGQSRHAPEHLESNSSKPQNLRSENTNVREDSKNERERKSKISSDEKRNRDSLEFRFEEGFSKNWIRRRRSTVGKGDLEIGSREIRRRRRKSLGEIRSEGREWNLEGITQAESFDGGDAEAMLTYLYFFL